MAYPVSIRRAARVEFLDAAAWYESRRTGLGKEFIQEVERCIALASEQPLGFSVVEADIRGIVTKQFPYTVYFRFRQNRVVVIAIFHNKRAPLDWTQRGN